MKICLKDSGQYFILNSDNTGHLPLSSADMVLNFTDFPVFLTMTFVLTAGRTNSIPSQFE